MVRELIDWNSTPLLAACSTLTLWLQSINARQTATANANGIGILGAGVGGVATAVNVGGTNVNSSVIA